MTRRGLRRWQTEALAQWAAQDGDFLAVATPGAGKTTLALAIANSEWRQGRTRRTVIVVPTVNLREQWGHAARSWEAGALDVFTYSEVASSPDTCGAAARREPTLLILDEAHHCEDDGGRWGEALAEAFPVVYRRLLLSGTPWRSNGAKIPFAQYDADQVICDYRYDYHAAAKDGIVRPLQFVALDGEVPELNGPLSEVAYRDHGRALRSAFDPGSDWLSTALRYADEHLTQTRLGTPDAGGLIIARDQKTARQYLDLMEHLTGERPMVAISEEPRSQRTLVNFAESTSRWLVTVRMVSEGVDIPRLAVLMYTTPARTPLFFEQAVGRVVRRRATPGDATGATVLMPALKPFLSHAKSLGSLRSIRPADLAQLSTASPMPGEPWDLSKMDVGTATVHSTTVQGGHGEQIDLADLERQAAAWSQALSDACPPSQLLRSVQAGIRGAVLAARAMHPQANIGATR